MSTHLAINFYFSLKLNVWKYEVMKKSVCIYLLIKIEEKSRTNLQVLHTTVFFKYLKGSPVFLYYPQNDLCSADPPTRRRNSLRFKAGFKRSWAVASPIGNFQGMFKHDRLGTSVKLSKVFNLRDLDYSFFKWEGRG